MELYRALARQNPDAFNPDLARSLCVLGLRQEENKRPQEALVCLAEGVRVLTPHFHALPQTHAALMGGLVQECQRLAQTLGQEPDAALLGPVLEVIQRRPGPPSSPQAEQSGG